MPQNHAWQRQLLWVEHYQICAFSLAKSDLDIIQIHLWFMTVLDAREMHTGTKALLEKSVYFLALTQALISEDTNRIFLNFFSLFPLYCNKVGWIEGNLDASLPRLALFSLLRTRPRLPLPTSIASLLALIGLLIRTVGMRELHNLVNDEMVLGLTLSQKQRIEAIEQSRTELDTLLAASSPFLVNGVKVMADPPDLIQQVCSVMVQRTFGPVTHQQYEERHPSVLVSLARTGKQLPHPIRSMPYHLVIHLPPGLLETVGHHQQLDLLQEEQPSSCSEELVEGEEAGERGAVSYCSQERIHAFCG